MVNENLPDVEKAVEAALAEAGVERDVKDVASELAFRKMKRIFPVTTFTRQDEATDHYITEADLVALEMAASKGRSSEVELVFWGAFLGFLSSAVSAVATAVSSKTIGAVTASETISFVLAACAFTGAVVLHLTTEKDGRKTVKGICADIRNRPKASIDE